MLFRLRNLTLKANDVLWLDPRHSSNFLTLTKISLTYTATQPQRLIPGPHQLYHICGRNQPADKESKELDVHTLFLQTSQSPSLFQMLILARLHELQKHAT